MSRHCRRQASQSLPPLPGRNPPQATDLPAFLHPSGRAACGSGPARSLPPHLPRRRRTPAPSGLNPPTSPSPCPHSLTAHRARKNVVQWYSRPDTCTTSSRRNVYPDSPSPISGASPPGVALWLRPSAISLALAPNIQTFQPSNISISVPRPFSRERPASRSGASCANSPIVL